MIMEIWSLRFSSFDVSSCELAFTRIYTSAVPGSVAVMDTDPPLPNLTKFSLLR